MKQTTNKAEQIRLWMEDLNYHDDQGNCCPDRSCCFPSIALDLFTRRRFYNSLFRDDKTEAQKILNEVSRRLTELEEKTMISLSGAQFKKRTDSQNHGLAYIIKRCHTGAFVSQSRVVKGKWRAYCSRKFSDCVIFTNQVEATEFLNFIENNEDFYIISINLDNNEYIRNT